MDVKLVIIEDSWDTRHELEINGQNVQSIYSLSEVPEDAIIGRSLIDGNDLIRYIKMGHEAGRKGEPLEIFHVKATAKEYE